MKDRIFSALFLCSLFLLLRETRKAPIFRRSQFGRSNSLKDLPIYLNGAWHGWHAFRRGLGTRLNEFGVDAETIQTIQRHGDVSTTRACYILPDRTKTETAMKRMDAVLKKYGIKA